MKLWHSLYFQVGIGATFSLSAFSTPALAAPAHILVLGPDGKPVAGAVVRILERLDYEKELPTRDLTTGANGDATVELDEGKVPHHSYAVRVLVPDFAVAGQDLKAGEVKLELQTAQKWSGTVLDAQQKPLAGVHLRLSGWRPENWVDFNKGATLDSVLGLEAVTDAQGRYVFDNVPQRGRATIEIDDPRFQKESYSLDVAQKEAPPLFVKLGGTVKGRILTGDGKPIGDIDIAIYTGDAFEHHTVAADGTFVIGGLKPDAKSVRAFGIADGWVLKPLLFDSLKAGETRQLPDWVGTRAMEVTGQIVDAVTKKPVPNVAINLMSEARENAATDAQGRFKTRSSNDIIFLRLNSETHLEKTLDQLSIPQTATQYDFGTVEMTPGVRVAGTVNDEKGAPQPYFSFRFENGDKSISRWVNTTDGVFEPLALTPGTYNLVSDYFEIVSPKTIEVPAVGKPFGPIAMVVKSTGDALPKVVTVAGRVVDGDDKPVAGAVVIFKGDPEHGDNGIKAVSNLDGHFSELVLGEAKPEIESIERPGYVLGSSGTISKVDANWQSGDIVLHPGGQIFSGRILADGKPVAGARVALAGNNWIEPARSDETGTFRFEDLPQGDIELLAGSATGFADLKTRGDAKDVVLNLESIPAIDNVALGNQMVAEQPQRGDWRLGWDIFGSKAMEAVQLRADEAIGTDGQGIVGKGGYDLLTYFADLERRDPAWLIERGPQLLPVFRPGTSKTRAEAILARVQASSSNADAQKAAGVWLDREKASTRGINIEGVTQLFAMATVADRLKRPEAASLLDLALTFAAQLPEKTRLDNVENWGALMARFSQAALESMLQDFDTVPQMRALGSAVRVLARSGDTKDAQLDLAKMEELQKTPEIAAADKAEPVPGKQHFSSNTLLLSARTELAKALATTDPATALKIAESIETGRDQISKLNALLEVAQRAPVAGQNDVVTAALREVSSTLMGDADYGAHAGAIAMTFDQKLGVELFQKALQQAIPDENNRRYQPSVATWAYEEAPFEPALGRVLLEREWSWRLAAYKAFEAAHPAGNKPNEGSVYNPNGGILGDLAWAMSVYDPQRALAWVQEVPEKYEQRDRTKARIAVTLLAKPQQRVNISRYFVYENADF